MEQWKPIPGYSRYEVSDTGSVRRIATMGSYKAGGILKGGVAKFGYPTVTLQGDDGKQKNKLVHQFVCAAFNGPKPSSKHCVAHNDGNPQNNNASNLRWATQSENILDAVKHGTLVDNAGEKHGNAKLTEDLVRAIRSDPLSCRKAAIKFGISNQTVSSVRSRRSWKHVA